jgi:hypothetical protein
MSMASYETNFDNREGREEGGGRREKGRLGEVR